MKVEINISNMPGDNSKEPGVVFSFASEDESATNAELVEHAARCAAIKHGLAPGKCYMWKISDDEGKRSAGGMVSVGLVAVACEFPREVTDAP